MAVTTADVEFMGDFLGARILFDEPDDEPLLGLTALESVGIEVDPRNQDTQETASGVTEGEELKNPANNKTPAELLAGRTLENGWVVEELIDPPTSSTGWLLFHFLHRQIPQRPKSIPQGYGLQKGTGIS